jgi:hypothetical protein
MILMESGNKIHTTGFDWPKNTALAKAHIAFGKVS